MSDYCGCEGEMPSVYEAKDVMAARKIHECSECDRVILPGESYHHVFGIWPTVDGPATFRICAWCMDLKLFMEAHIPCVCLLHGYLLGGAQDEIDNNPEAEVLRPEYQAMLAEIRARPSRASGARVLA